MKTTKYNSFFLSVFLFVPFLFLQSCKDEEEGPNNAFTFDDQTFTITHGYVINQGIYAPEGSASHNSHAIILSDGPYLEEDFDGSFLLAFNLLSPVSQPLELAGGRYEFVSRFDFDQEVDDLSEVRFYVSSSFSYENDNTVEAREISGGVVNVFNTEENDFSITFDVDFSLGKELIGGFNGPFVFVQGG